ncbi:MAG: hypothetical protein K6F35_09560 [Lachnospiraceae bacterium]|nr:hypothetical protein [Lachnospiraceae bacterium]
MIISVDCSGTESVLDVARNYRWSHGEKYVEYAEQNLGLRKHVLKCGNYLNQYDLSAIAVFEDDILPSKYFYSFAAQAVSKYRCDRNIGGISLYSHHINPGTGCFFHPLYSRYDVFFMQYAQSWGQIWLRDQWNDFIAWYDEHQEWPPERAELIPDDVLGWSESSWLKYHIAYCILNDKWFVYPYEALTTNYMEMGEHNRELICTNYQIPFRNNEKSDMILPDLSEQDTVKYDAFFENVELENVICDGRRVLVDLYGNKKDYSGYDFILSSNEFDAESVKTYGLALRPLENNIIYNVQGDFFSLYKISEVKMGHKKSDTEHELQWMEYNFKLMTSTRQSCKVLAYKLKKYLFDRVKKQR